MNFLVILMTKIVNHICFMLFSLKLIRCIFNFQGLIDFTCLENERQVFERLKVVDITKMPHEFSRRNKNMFLGPVFDYQSTKYNFKSKLYYLLLSKVECFYHSLVMKRGS